MIDLDPAVEIRLNRVAEWYNIAPERWVEIVLQREFDRLAGEVPNLAYLMELP